MEKSASKAKYQVGELVKHTLFSYRGVVVSIDPVFSLSEAWYASVARSKPPKDQPWYHVLVDETSKTTYVAERNLRKAQDGIQVDHPLLGQFFDCFDGARYLSRRPRT